MFTKVVKRDGRLVDFNLDKITHAISKAGEATGEFSREIAEKLLHQQSKKFKTV
jgi:anaerobic ribonucleoside-triphosphate reductase